GGLGMLFMEAASRFEEPIRDAVRRANERTVQGLAALLRRGQDEGSVRGDVPTVALAWLVLSQVHSRQFRRARTADMSPALEAAMLEALLVALGPPAPAYPARGGRQ